jgi:iron-sulfur cluster assembly protein
MLTLTDNAQLAIRSLLAAPTDAGTETGVRIATAPGPNGEAPSLALALVAEPAPGDQVLDEGGARVYLDETAAQMLDHETLDAQIDTEAQQVDFFVA